MCRTPLLYSGGAIAIARRLPYFFDAGAFVGRSVYSVR